MVASNEAVSNDPYIIKTVMESFKYSCQMFYIILYVLIYVMCVELL